MVIFHYANSEPIGMEIQKSVSTATLGRVGIEIIGKSSHWGEPEKGINAISVSAKVIDAIDKINIDSVSYTHLYGVQQMDILELIVQEFSEFQQICQVPYQLYVVM